MDLSKCRQIKKHSPPHADSVHVVSIHFRLLAVNCHRLPSLCISETKRFTIAYYIGLSLIVCLHTIRYVIPSNSLSVFTLCSIRLYLPVIVVSFRFGGLFIVGQFYMPEASTNETRAYFGALSVTSYSLQPVFSLTRSRKFAASSLLTTSFTAVNPSVLGFCISKEHG